MRLTRRDALAVLAGLGIVGGGAVSVGVRESRQDEGTPAGGEFTDDTLATLTAVASVVYPSTVEGHRAFVETYVGGRTAGRSAYRASVVEAAGAIDDAAQAWYGRRYPALDGETRDSVLRELGVDTATPAPDGSTAERVRHYVVNELLYAFYASPTGGELAGIENPIGHPGGIESYREGPDGG